MLRVILELVRIMFIFLIFGSMLGGFAKFVYTSFGMNVDNNTGGWLVGLAILISLFVLYRNKLQFSGFYKGKSMVKLSKKVSLTLVSCSALMLVIAPFLH